MADDPPSLRDFDYFGDEDRGLKDVDHLFVEEEQPGDTADQVGAFRARQRKQVRQLIVSLVFFVVATWFVWGYRDWIAYAFSEPTPPEKMGDVVDIERGALVHNDYVEIEGVTLHRGMVQRLVRGIGFTREQLHYLELSGAGGIFLEVPPELGIEFATFVRVSGRVVDPKRNQTYIPLLREYESRYYQERRPHERIIQVNVAPGQGRGPLYVVFAFLAGVVALNLWSLSRVIRTRRSSPR